MASSARYLFNLQNERSRETVLNKLLNGVASMKSSDEKIVEFPCRALLIDDDPVSVKLMELCLRRAGCETLIVTSAAEAATFYANEHFDLVVLDWNMPDLNGGETIELLQSIATHDRRRRMQAALTPILTYSTQDLDHSNFSAPMDNFAFIGHVPKSSPYIALRDRLAEVLRLLRHED